MLLSYCQGFKEHTYAVLLEICFKQRQCKLLWSTHQQHQHVAKNVTVQDSPVFWCLGLKTSADINSFYTSSEPACGHWHTEWHRPWRIHGVSETSPAKQTRMMQMPRTTLRATQSYLLASPVNTCHCLVCSCMPRVNAQQPRLDDTDHHTLHEGNIAVPAGWLCQHLPLPGLQLHAQLACIAARHLQLRPPLHPAAQVTDQWWPWGTAPSCPPPVTDLHACRITDA